MSTILIINVVDFIALGRTRNIDFPARLLDVTIINIDDRLRTLVIIYVDIVLKVASLILPRRLEYELRANIDIAAVVVLLIGSSQTAFAIHRLVNIHQTIKTVVHGSFMYVPIAVIIVRFDVNRLV